MYAFLRPFLFNTDPEKTHEITLSLLEKSQKFGMLGFLYGKQELTTECMGLTFTNPVGLAAGLDKNGEYIDALAALGFWLHRNWYDYPKTTAWQRQTPSISYQRSPCHYQSHGI